MFPEKQKHARNVDLRRITFLFVRTCFPRSKRERERERERETKKRKTKNKKLLGTLIRDGKLFSGHVFPDEKNC